MSLQLVAPRIQPPLDENFRPAVLVNQNFRRELALLGIRLILGLERSGGEVTRFETRVYSPIRQISRITFYTSNALSSFCFDSAADIRSMLETLRALH